MFATCRAEGLGRRPCKHLGGSSITTNMILPSVPRRICSLPSTDESGRNERGRIDFPPKTHRRPTGHPTNTLRTHSSADVLLLPLTLYTPSLHNVRSTLCSPSGTPAVEERVREGPIRICRLWPLGSISYREVIVTATAVSDSQGHLKKSY